MQVFTMFHLTFPTGCFTKHSLVWALVNSLYWTVDLALNLNKLPLLNLPSCKVPSIHRYPFSAIVRVLVYGASVIYAGIHNLSF